MIKILHTHISQKLEYKKMLIIGIQTMFYILISYSDLNLQKIRSKWIST